MKDDNNHSNDKIEFEIFSTLRKIIKAVDIYSIRLKENHGINSSQLSCLLALGDLYPISLSSLSKKVSLSPSMITGIIDQLEKKELVKRVRDSSDRRIILIELTEKGIETLKYAPLSFQKKFMEGLDLFSNKKKNEISKNLSDLLSLIASEVLIDSPILSTEDKLPGMEPSIINSEESIKDEKHPKSNKSKKTN